MKDVIKKLKNLLERIHYGDIDRDTVQSELEESINELEELE